MSHIHVEASDVIDASPKVIYAILTDYRKGHPAILPKPYFTDLTVVKGGKGAGSVILVRMRVLGVEAAYTMEVSEPEPDRVLVEADENAGVTTTFTVDPLDGGTKSRVTIATDMKASPGFKGFLEKLITPRITRSIYKKELRQLADYVGGKPTPPPRAN
jgi:hypothetical protein